MRTCIFCGSDKDMEREHLWPDWVGIMLADFIGDKSPHRRSTLSIESGKEYDVREWTDRSASRRVKIVCHDCNHHWMGDLEADVSEVLKPMMLRGEETRLGTGTQRTLAFWALKTAITLQYSRPANQRGIPDAHVKFVYKHRNERKVPPKVHVWMTAYSGDPPSGTLFTSRSLWLSLASGQVDPRPRIGRPNAYMATLGVNQLQFKVFGHVLQGRYEVEPQDIWRDFRLNICPSSGRPVTWPPARIFATQQDLMDFAVNVFGGPP